MNLLLKLDSLFPLSSRSIPAWWQSWSIIFSTILRIVSTLTIVENCMNEYKKNFYLSNHSSSASLNIEALSTHKNSLTEFCSWVTGIGIRVLFITLLRH